MRIIRPDYEIRTKFSDGGIEELKEIERDARVCYQSEGDISEDGESAINLIRKLIKNGHEAMLEHSKLSVRFTVDRGFSHELVRHRLCSFAQESTRWCNYSKDKFGKQLTFVMPTDFNKWFLQNVDLDTYSVFLEELEENACKAVDHGCEEDLKFPNGFLKWVYAMYMCEDQYMAMLEDGCSPQLARGVLPNSLKTDIVVTANFREWRNIFKLRTAKDAHPDMRRIMTQLLKSVSMKIPVVFDDIRSTIDWNYI